MVEFALIFPTFILMIIGIIEFAFLFNALLSVNFSARNAALAAAEAGDTLGADCVILREVEGSVAAPASRDRIERVEIFQTRANSSGLTQMVGSATVYRRTGSTTCTFVDGSSLTVPYSRTADGFPESDRCNVLGGCGGGHPTVDNVGVRVTYTHTYVTPLENLVGGNGTLTFDRTSVMRMEPVL